MIAFCATEFAATAWDAAVLAAVHAEFADLVAMDIVAAIIAAKPGLALAVVAVILEFLHAA